MTQAGDAWRAGPGAPRSVSSMPRVKMSPPCTLLLMRRRHFVAGQADVCLPMLSGCRLLIPNHVVRHRPRFSKGARTRIQRVIALQVPNVWVIAVPR